MKKTLLLSAMAALALPAAVAGVDPAVYPEVNGLNVTSVWAHGRFIDEGETYKAFPFAITNKARTATVAGDKILVAFSQTLPDGDEATNDFAHICIFDYATGKYIKQVQLTLDGQPIKGLLCANQIGTDYYGNVWFAGLASDPSVKPISLYHITDIDNGTTKLIAELSLPEEEQAYGSRHDYYDLAGDVTGVKDGTVFMTAQATGSEAGEGKIQDKVIIGWNREQGSDTWGPHFNDGEYYAGVMDETYPDGILKWNGAPVVVIACDPDSPLGSLFYVDPFVGYPTLYNTEGAMLESFASADPESLPKQGPNGACEFNLGNDTYLAYAFTDYDSDPGCTFAIAKLGENKSFEGLTKMWQLPEKAFGATGDGGSRIVSLHAKNVTDANGVEGVHIFAYKSQNGLGLYTIAPKGFQSDLDGATLTVADNTDAPVEYFNLQGIRVANPTTGLYITRQGNKVTKTIK